MATVILYHEPDAYNVISTSSGEIYFDEALSLENLKLWWKDEFGRQGMRDLENMLLDVVHKNGASSFNLTLKDYIGSYNSTKKRGERLTNKQFIAKFLTVEK